VLGLGSIGKRLAEGAIGLFALLGFLYVPLGRHTGFEHARAVIRTPAAQEAFDDVKRSVLSLRQRAVAFVTGQVSSPPAPEATAPERKRADDEQKRLARQPEAGGPRPVPPQLK
jgi:hypothetical protein